MPLPQIFGRGKRRKKETVPKADVPYLVALQQSAEGFPPLKSAVDGVLVVWDIAERTEHCEYDAAAIAERANEVLNDIADAVPDGARISPPMLQSVQNFVLLLDDIQPRMSAIADASAVSRVEHRKQHERALQDILAELDAFFARICKKRKKRALPGTDALHTTLFALNESADAFPPLKSAVGGVLAVWEIAERTKHCKSDAVAIAQRTKQIMEVIAKALDGAIISVPMSESIEMLTRLLDGIECRMNAIADASAISRLKHLKRHESVLQDIRVELDAAYLDFVAASSLRVEVQQSTIGKELAELPDSQSTLLLYFKASFFLGGP